MAEVYKRTYILQWNANSLQEKSGDFRQFVAQYSFPILVISEARVNNKFRLANYVMYQSKRPKGTSRCLVGVRKECGSILLFTSDSSALEYAVCKVSYGTTSLTEVGVYIEPQKTVTRKKVRGIIQKT
ncbi:unnamed protein product [Ixodes persulcatus]